MRDFFSPLSLETRQGSVYWRVWQAFSEIEGGCVDEGTFGVVLDYAKDGRGFIEPRFPGPTW